MANLFKDIPHIAKLNDSNFSTWKYQIQLFFYIHDIGQIVDGSSKQPAAPGPDATESQITANTQALLRWKKEDGLARSAIHTTVDELQQFALSTCSSAHAMWSSLLEQYEQPSEETFMVFCNVSMSSATILVLVC